MSRSTKLAKALIPPPNSPKESRTSPVTSITYLQYLLVLPTKFHPNLYTNHFPRFPVPPPMSKNLVGIWNKSSETWVPSKYNFIKIWSPVLKLKILKFFQINTPQLPQKEWICSNYVNHVSITCAYSSHKFHLNLSTLSIFQDFCFPPPAPYVSRSNLN